jgi:putative ABC transport system permease protein
MWLSSPARLCARPVGIYYVGCEPIDPTLHLVDPRTGRDHALCRLTGYVGNLYYSSFYNTVSASPDGTVILYQDNRFRLKTGRAMRFGMFVVGRLFDARDRETSPGVAIVNEALVQQFMQGRDPIGQKVLVGVPHNLMRNDLIPGVKKFEWVTVVGVVGNVRKFAVAERPGPEVYPEVYLPYPQTPPLPMFRASMFVVVRTAGEPARLIPAARQQVWAIDGDQPIERLATMDTLVGTSLQQWRFSTTLLGLFAALATVLAAVGAYGVLSYTVARRTVEIGIRLALGADARDILRDVIRHGLLMTAAGAVLGLAVSLALSRVMSGLLYDVSAMNPGVLAAVTVLLLIVGVIAAYVPARRAMQVDPMLALRTE